MKNFYLLLIAILLEGFSMTSDASQQNIVLIADPKVLAIHIIDNQDEMIDLKNQNDIAYGPSPEIPNNTDYTKLRKSVYEKLKQAQGLLPKGLHFCLYEGYRSLVLQKKLFDERYKIIKKEHPTWSHEKIFTESTKLVSPVVNLDGSKNIPPHSTGGAFDIYLIDDKGNAIDMGIHPKDWIDDDGANALTASTIISDQAKKNRKIMNTALSAVGFVNYPTEYWHWSYGDRYWAYHKKAANAVYSSYKPSTNSLSAEKYAE